MTRAPRAAASSSTAGPERLPGEEATPSPEALRAAIQRFVRSFGLLATDRTPCGLPLSASYAHALVVLREREHAGHRTTQQQLAAVLGIDKSNVTRLGAKMVRAGHVGLERSPNDRRARLLTLTSAGRRLAARVSLESHDRYGRVLAALPSRSRASVLAALTALERAVAKTRRSEPPE